jgi:hypothetical protein
MNALGNLLLGVMLAASTYAAETNLVVADKPAPDNLTEPIRAVLQAKAVQLLAEGKPIYQLWWVREVPLKQKPSAAGKALESVDEMTLLGAATVGEGQRDYKDSEIPPGAYTVRFGLQPQDGDHLGTAEFPYFAVLIPAKNDPDPAGIKTYKSMVKASGKATATGHPAILSLRPVASEASESPALTTPAPEHRAIRFKLPAKAGGEQTSITFELVYHGKSAH